MLVTFAEVQGTPAGAVPRMKRFTVSGLFEAGYNEVDRGVGFANMQDRSACCAATVPPACA